MSLWDLNVCIMLPNSFLLIDFLFVEISQCSGLSLTCEIEQINVVTSSLLIMFLVGVII